MGRLGKKRAMTAGFGALMRDETLAPAALEGADLAPIPRTAVPLTGTAHWPDDEIA
jgi:hypothetical protein